MEVKVEEETLTTGGGEQEAHGSGRARRRQQIHSHMSRKVAMASILVLKASWVVEYNLDIIHRHASGLLMYVHGHYWPLKKYCDN